jgi:D-glycero-alpha-D-manno-heptose-7-phosphate kinase
MIISRTPLRISFVGGGTDFEDYYKISGGAVISTAIDKYIYVMVNHKFDDKIHVRYSQVECVDSLEELKHNLVREALRMVGIGKGIEIAIVSDIPSQGSGLGSSSALAVGLLKALYLYKGYDIPADELAKKACSLEIEKLRAPIGKQDQYAAAFGGFNYISFHSFERVKVSTLYRTGNGEKLLWIKDATMLFYLNGRASNDILETHQNNIGAKNEILNEQKMLVPLFLDWINGSQNNNEKIGELITRSWNCKKEMTPTATSPRIEEIFAFALNAGALGAKLCGAGGGGFLMVLCEGSKQQIVRNALSNLLELRFGFEKEGSKIIYAT